MNSGQRAAGSGQDEGGGPPAEIKFIAFRTGSENFLIDIMAVRQILPYSGPTLDGKPVVDLSALIALKAKENPQQPVVMLTQTPAGPVALKVDEVRRPMTLKASELLPAPDTVRGVSGEFLVAIAPHGDEIFLVLDVDRLT
jgi:chemotaxis signal transduction protein